jgi:hypothetical protein
MSEAERTSLGAIVEAAAADLEAVERRATPEGAE